MLCHHSFSTLSPAQLAEGADWTAPVGNGPFIIIEKTEERIVFEKNPYYWDSGNVALRRLVIQFTVDGKEASALWNSGAAHWLSGDMDIDSLTDRSGIMVNAMFATHYYFIRSSSPPWNDPRVRRALSLALPWDEIRSGLYLPAKTLIFPITGYPEIAGIDGTDAPESLRLLADAGFADGALFPQLVIRIPPSEEARRIALLMAGAWQTKLHVPTLIQEVPFAQYQSSLKRDDYVVGSTGWIGDFADPYTFLQMFQKDSNLNDARYNDADYEALIEKSMNEDGDERMATLSEAEAMLLDRGVVLPISYSPAINIVDTDELDGWYPNAMDLHPFKYLSFKEKKPLPGVASSR
jgi:peptide/nickel transport system substrate-binding protein/oligopeptide transport system substrate-binding protein